MVGRASAQPSLLSTPYEKPNALLLVQLPPSARKHKSAGCHWTYEYRNINFGEYFLTSLYSLYLFPVTSFGQEH